MKQKKSKENKKGIRKKWVKPATWLFFLKAVEATLLLLLGDGIHTLLQVSSGQLRIAALLALLLDLVQAPPVVLRRLVLDILQLRLQLVAATTPAVAIRLDLVLLVFKVRQCLLESLSQLLLGVEMLLDGADAGLLIFMDLGDGDVLASRPGGGRAWLPVAREWR